MKKEQVVFLIILRRTAFEIIILNENTQCLNRETIHYSLHNSKENAFDGAQLLYDFRKTLVKYSQKFSVSAIQCVSSQSAALFWDAQSAVAQSPVLSVHANENIEALSFFRQAKMKDYFYENCGQELKATSLAATFFSLKKRLSEAALTKPLMAASLETWFVYQLSGQQHFKQSLSQASESCFFNLHQKKWDTVIKADILPDNCILPELSNNHDQPWALTKHFAGLVDGIPIYPTLTMNQTQLLGCESQNFSDSLLCFSEQSLSLLSHFSRFPKNLSKAVSSRQSFRWSEDFESERVILQQDRLVADWPNTLFGSFQIDVGPIMKKKIKERKALIESILSLNELELNETNHQRFQQKSLLNIHGVMSNTSKNDLMIAYLSYLVFSMDEHLQVQEKYLQQNVQNLSFVGSKKQVYAEALANLMQRPITYYEEDALLLEGATKVLQIQTQFFKQHLSLSFSQKQRYIPFIDPISIYGLKQSKQSVSQEKLNGHIINSHDLNT